MPQSPWPVGWACSAGVVRCVALYVTSEDIAGEEAISCGVSGHVVASICSYYQSIPRFNGQFMLSNGDDHDRLDQVQEGLEEKLPVIMPCEMST